MASRQPRRLATLLTVELPVVASLAGFGPGFPRDVPSGTAWRFLGSHGFVLVHAVLGLVVLAQAVLLVAVSTRRLLPMVCLLGLILACAAGVAYVSAGQTGAALTSMTIGWVTALVAAVLHLVGLRHSLPARASA
jgi:hypothetical protein